MISPARAAAYDAIRAVHDGRTDLPAALARTRASLGDARDRALAAEIATGTLRWRAALDHLIERAGRRPLSRLDPEIVDILRLSAYQLLHLDRVPAAAAINEGVELARRARKRSATAFVNAVLRGIARMRGRLPLPPPPRSFDGGAERAPVVEAALDYLSITLSHPRWLVARWLHRYGMDATETWARFNNAAAPLTLRANSLKTSVDDLAERLARHGVEVQRTRYAPEGLVVIAGNPLATPLADSGLFVVQDEASQLVALLVQARSGERGLDACAAPGGKTTALAAAMGHRGLIVAADLRGRRIDLLRRTVTLMGATSVRIVRMDLGHSLPFVALFDWVLVDAPCSGLGTLRRDPEIRWRRAETDLPRLAAAQRRMLESAAAAIRPGGRLVYATCSSEPEENDEVIHAFLDAHRTFALLDPRQGDEGIPAGLDAVLDRTGCLRTAPHLHGLEAFFGAVLRQQQS